MSIRYAAGGIMTPPDFCWACGFDPCVCGKDCSESANRAYALQHGGLTAGDYEEDDCEPLPEPEEEKPKRELFKWEKPEGCDGTLDCRCGDPMCSGLY